jgi:hypothetical protein
MNFKAFIMNELIRYWPEGTIGSHTSKVYLNSPEGKFAGQSGKFLRSDSSRAYLAEKIYDSNRSARSLWSDAITLNKSLTDSIPRKVSASRISK